MIATLLPMPFGQLVKSPKLPHKKGSSISKFG
jgi:hypothetical protein